MTEAPALIGPEPGTVGCVTCTAEGRGQGAGYCARYRCYCGHPECWAYASFQPVERGEPRPLEVIPWTD